MHTGITFAFLIDMSSTQLLPVTLQYTDNLDFANILYLCPSAQFSFAKIINADNKIIPQPATKQPFPFQKVQFFHQTLFFQY